MICQLSLLFSLMVETELRDLSILVSLLANELQPPQPSLRHPASVQASSVLISFALPPGISETVNGSLEQERTGD